MKVFWFSVVLMSCLAGTLQSAPPAQPAVQQQRPNVLFILTDDQRWDAMSCAGNRMIQTPHIDRLAAAGVRLASRLFERFDELSVLLVGAGEMIELTATHFGARHPKHMTFANRTVERAQQLDLALVHQRRERHVEIGRLVTPSDSALRPMEAIRACAYCT